METNTAGILAGLAVTNGYDAFTRRTDLSVQGSSLLSHTTYSYTNDSRLWTASDGTNNATYSFIANSPLVSQITFKSNNAIRMTTTKQYDLLNRLTLISNAPSVSAAVAFNYAYNDANQRTKNTLVDGGYWEYQYDSLGQVTSGRKLWRDGTPVAGQQFEYGFDDIGNRQQTKSGGDETGAKLRSANYTNNTLNEIVGREVPSYVDVIGIALATNTVMVNGQTAYRKGEYFRNELSVNNTNVAIWASITNTSPGQMTITGSRFIPKTAEIFYYDADGNLTNDGRWKYTWDGENQLTKMTVNTNVGPQFQLTFSYDAKGRRIQKFVSTNGVAIYTNKFLYDGWNVICSLNPDSSPRFSYVWGSDLSGNPRGGGGVGGLLEVSFYGSATTNAFAGYDGNGNLVTLTDTTGTNSAIYEYGPFGELLRASGPTASDNSLRFSTKYQDDETDLVYYGHRYYSTSAGKWISRDPGEEENGYGLYGFVANDPINRGDYLGLYEIDFHFYAVYYLMRAKCWTANQANNEAAFSQAVDDYWRTNPLILGAEAGLPPYDDQAASLLADYHFYGSTKTIATKRNPSDIVNRIRTSHDSISEGAYLHIYADSWAHEGFTAYSVRSINYRTGSWRGYTFGFVGHVDAAEGGHAPDYPYNDPAKAVEAALAIFDILDDNCRRCGIEPPVDRGTVISDMQSGFSNHSDILENRISKWQSIIERRFGESVTYKYPELYTYPIHF